MCQGPRKMCPTETRSGVCKNMSPYLILLNLWVKGVTREFWSTPAPKALIGP